MTNELKQQITNIIGAVKQSKICQCSVGHRYEGDRCSQCETLDAITSSTKLYDLWFEKFCAKEISESENSMYPYCASKASDQLMRLEHRGKRGDFIPLPQEDWQIWKLRQLLIAYKEFLYEAKGLTPADCFLSPPLFVKQLFENQDFRLVKAEKTCDVVRMNFCHLFYEQELSVYCRFRLLINDRLKPYGVFLCEPEIVNISETDANIQIHTDYHIAAVAAEYAYIDLFYPDCQFISQSYRNESGEDVLHLRTPDGTPCEIVFDISEAMKHLLMD